MANEKRTAELSLLAKVDQQTIERSKQRLRELREEEQRRLAVTKSGASADREAAESIGAVGRKTNDYINSIRKRLAVARLDVDAQQRQIAHLHQEKEAREDVAIAAERQADSVHRAAGAGGAARGQSRFEASGDVSTGLSAAAALLPGGAGNTVRGFADLAGLVEQLPRLSSGFKTLTGAATAAEGATVAVGVGIGTIAAAAVIAIPAIVAVALAIKKFAKQIEESKTFLNAAIDAQLEYVELVHTGTEESIQAKLQELEVQRAIQKDQIAMLQEQLDNLGLIGGLLAGGEFKERIKELQTQLDSTGLSITAAENALKSSEVKRRTEAEAAKEQAEKLAESTTATKAATTAERIRTGAIQATTQALSYSQQIAQQVQDKQKKIADLQKQDAERFAAFQEARNKALADGELTQLTIIRDAKRDQAAAFRRSEFEIAKIRIRAAESEFEALLTLDFAAAARARRDLTSSISEARSNASFDAQERLIETQFRLEDARVSTEKQLLELSQDRARVEVEAARAAAEIARQSLQAIVSGLAQIKGLSYAPSITSRAGGGPLAAFQASTYNELKGQRESWNSGGRSTLLPGGAGMIIPFKSGTMQAGGGGGVSVAINMAGMTFNDKREMARVAGDMVEKRLNEVLN